MTNEHGKINPFMHNVVKWPNIMHERVKLNKTVNCLFVGLVNKRKL